MNVILTGATGLAGSEVLRQCLADAAITGVTVLSRRDLPQADPRLRQIVHGDFLNYDSILRKLADHDACLWCLGISQNDVNAQEYQKITRDFALAGAKAFSSVNPNLTFCFLSGQGADSTEKSRVLFGRVKGETENKLDLLGLKHLYHLRPGYIHPVAAGTSRHLWDRFLSPVAPLLHKMVPNMLIEADDFALAMIEVAKHGFPRRILENRDLREISTRLRGNAR
jgi:uncharacterized protein YbjT (DUF2867 family)